jgi:fido (protein-threonine AMPylation protein)
MTDLFQEPDDATPLTPAERDGLRQSWITHRRDLNEAEQENIVQGAAWARRQRGLTAAKLLDDGFAQRLHGRMFGDVWEWAGAYRKTERNIGIASHPILPSCSMTRASGSSIILTRLMRPPSAFIIGWCGSIRFPTAMAVMRVSWRTC